jgi:hypothetical protein
MVSKAIASLDLWLIRAEEVLTEQRSLTQEFQQSNDQDHRAVTLVEVEGD